MLLTMQGRPHIELERGRLAIGGIPAMALVERYGTPLYVTDVDRVVERYAEAKKALSSRHENVNVAFAYKANSTPGVVRALAREGAGATVVSEEGVRLARACGVRPRDVVIDGPSKSDEDLAAAVKAGVGMINAESVEEVLVIESVCASLGVRGRRVGFRVNFDIRAETHAGLATGGRSHKFGVAREEVVRFCEEYVPRLERVTIVGLHSHAGSQISDPGVFRTEAERLVELSEELRTSGVRIDEFNVGGGLGVSYDGGGGPPIGEYADATAGTFSRKGRGDARVVSELGRWIVADSTVLLTRVNYVKEAGGTSWALVDAGMNTFLRPALYGARHRVVAAHAADRTESDRAYDIGGPVCETTDTFGSGFRLGVQLARGDVVAVLDAGAYGSSMSSTYNMRPLPRTVFVAGGRARVSPAC
jgi:diaminopimelate decarboxylase